LEDGEAAEHLAPRRERRVPAVELAELRQQQPSLFGLDRQRCGDVAGEALGEPGGHRALLHEERQPRRHLEVQVWAVGPHAQDRGDAPVLHLLDGGNGMSELPHLVVEPCAHTFEPAGPGPGWTLRGNLTLIEGIEVSAEKFALLLVLEDEPVQVTASGPASMCRRTPSVVGELELEEGLDTLCGLVLAHLDLP
jgi:hypothetical protein